MEKPLRELTFMRMSAAGLDNSPKNLFESLTDCYRNVGRDVLKDLTLRVG